jgi:hypothetical protein
VAAEEAPEDGVEEVDEWFECVVWPEYFRLISDPGPDEGVVPPTPLNMVIPECPLPTTPIIALDEEVDVTDAVAAPTLLFFW